MIIKIKNILKNTIILLLLSCVFFSFITYTINIKNLFFLKFLTISEVFGGLAITLFIINNLEKITALKKTNTIYKTSFLLLISFCLGLLITKELKSTLLAIMILVYLVILSFVLYDTFKNNFLLLVKIIIATFLALSIVGFYDYFAAQHGLIAIFPNVARSYIISGFRYFGQTGDYTFMVLTFLLPFQFSNLSSLLNKKWFVTLRFSTFLGILVLLGTSRISSILSLGIGLFLWVIFTRNWKLFKKYILEILIFAIIIATTRYTFPEIYKNVTYRYKSRISNRVDNSMEADFILDNFTFAIHAFKEKPLLGHGLASITNPTNGHEIHGTYLKILAETGLLGTFFYLIFIGSILTLIYKKIKDKNAISNVFFMNYLPFFIASIIMWSYEYHLRKKEFWMVLALILIISQINNSAIKKELNLQNE